MNQLTKRKLKSRIIKTSIVEILSLLDIQHVKGAIDVKNEDLIDIAYLAQHEHERAGIKFVQLIKDGRLVLFFNALDCPIPLETVVEAIVLEDKVICKKPN